MAMTKKDYEIVAAAIAEGYLDSIRDSGWQDNSGALLACYTTTRVISYTIARRLAHGNPLFSFTLWDEAVNKALREGLKANA